MDRFLLQFLAIVEAGSFNKAAEALLISQPALTHNMKKLEENLGVQLLERSTRGIRLTAYGETLYQSAEMMRRTYANALDQIERQRADLDHGINIGTGYSAWILFLRDMLFDHAKSHPKAPINVTLCNALRGMDHLLAGDINLLISHQLVDLARAEELLFLPLGPARDHYFARPDHPLHGRALNRTEILTWPTTIAFPPEARPRRLLRHGAETAADLPPGSAGHQFTSSSLQACIDFALTTDAVLIHNDILSDYLTQKGLVALQLLEESRPLPARMGIYILRDSQSDPVMATLLARIESLWHAKVAGPR